MADGTLKVGTITTSSGSGTITLGQSGETVTVTNGVMSGQNYPAFESYGSANMTGVADAVWTKLTMNTEKFDTDSMYDSSTNYRFTPTSSGKYFVGLAVRFNTGSVSITSNFIFKNGSQFYAGEYSNISNNNWFNGTIVTLNGSSDYIEAYCYQNSGGSVNIIAGQFFAYKLIGV